MTTKRKSTSTAKYQRLSNAQLVTLIRKWQKRYVSLAKTPEWETTKGWTPKQLRVVLSREIKRATLVLRVKTLLLLDGKLKELKKQLAKHHDCTINGAKVLKAAVIKRLVAKRRQIAKTTNPATLTTLSAGLKVSKYKNSTIVTRTISKRKITAKKRTAVKRSTVSKKRSSAKRVGKAAGVKYKKETKTLKKEIQKLKLRNSFMRLQVAKFRKEVAQMQRHYGTLKNNSAPKLRVIATKQVGQDVSNIVSFSNALSNAILRQQRKAR